MAKPINALTGDAPDSENPSKRMAAPKAGSGIKIVSVPVDKRDKDIYTAEKGMPPMPDEGPTKNVKKYAAGGSVSRRADGIAQRGKTNCKMR